MNRSGFREKELWILIGSGLLLFYGPLIYGDTFFFRDLHFHFFPQKLRFVELIRSGYTPLWDAYLHGGQPFLADLNNMALYPANLLYLILPPVRAFNLDIIFHVLLCACAAYLLARSLGVSPISSMVAGAVYGFCGYTLSLTNLLNRLTAMPYLPLMLLSLHNLFTRHRKRWFALAVLFGVLQTLAGAPEMTLLTFLVIAGWFLFTDWPSQLTRRLTIYVVLSLLVAGITAVQIIPTAEMMQQSLRSSDAHDYDSFSAWSLHHKRLPELIFPEFLGHTDHVSKKDYWGAGFESMGFPFILSIYFGWFALSLAIFGAIFSPGRLRLFLSAIAIFAIVLSMGRYLPGFRLLYESLPFATGVRYPIKVLAAGVLPISMLAALGLDRIQETGKRIKSIAIYFWISAASFVAFAVLFRLSQDFAAGFMNSYFNQSTPTSISGTGTAITHTALISLLVACIYQYSILKSHPPAAMFSHAALTAILLFDLIRCGFAVSHYAPAEFLTQTPELVKTVRNVIGTGRFYRSPNPARLVLQLPANDVRYFYRWHLETLHNYLPALYSIPVIYHEDFDNLAQKNIVKISDYLFHASPESRVSFLSAGGVSLFMSAGPLSDPGLEPLSTVRNSSNQLFYLYRNRKFKGNAFFVPRAVFVKTEEEAFLQMTKPEFDASSVVYIDAEGSVPVSDGKDCTKAGLKTIQAEPTRMSYLADLDCDGYLYFAQPFYKGWITLIDGIEARTWRANYAFSATIVKAGEHRIERIYRPRSVTMGLWITMASIVLLAILTKFVRI